VWRPAGFENRPAESDHRRPDGDILSLSPSLRRPSALKEALLDTGFSLAREKRLALFFISRTVQADRAIGAGASAQKTPLTNARRLLTAV